MPFYAILCRAWTRKQEEHRLPSRFSINSISKIANNSNYYSVQKFHNLPYHRSAIWDKRGWSYPRRKQIQGFICRRGILPLNGLYNNFSKLVVNVVLGTAPMTVSLFSPPLKIMTVGMLLMPYLEAIPGLSSVFTL